MPKATKKPPVLILRRQPRRQMYDWGTDKQVLCSAKDSDYELHAQPKRGLDYEMERGYGKGIADFCVEEFHRATTMRLRPGQQVKVRINIKVVK
jgi:hypothetical protein